MEGIRKKLGPARNWLPTVLMVLGSLWLFQGALAQTGGHGVFVRGADYDAGTVKVGSIVSHNLRLINLSTQAVEVDAEPGCGCTVIEAPNKALAPLHSETIKAQVDTGGMRPGAQRKAIMVNLRSGNKTWQQTAWINFRLQ